MGTQIDELIRSRRKSISLTITNDAKLVVRAPLRLPLREIQRVVDEKADWIESKKSVSLNRIKNAHKSSLGDGGEFLLLGSPLKLSYCEGLKRAKVESGCIFVPANLEEEKLKNLLIKWYKAQAKTILASRVEEISGAVGIPYKDLTITSARRRWGSCNSRNQIRLTWRLIMAEQKSIDYVIIHELCHVIHKNHSKSFWKKVEELMPDYKVNRKRLKENAFILDIL